MSSFENDEYLNHVLSKLSTLCVCSRYMINLKTGKVETCLSEITLSAVKDNDDIIAKLSFRDSETFETLGTYQDTIPTQVVINILNECISTGTSPLNTSEKLDDIIQSIAKKAFEDRYKDEAVTTFDLLRNSNIIITDKDGKPIIVKNEDKVGEKSYFVDFTDPSSKEAKNMLKLALKYDILDQNKDEFASFYDNVEAVVDDCKELIFNVYSKKLCPDAIFQFHCKKDIKNIYEIEDSCISQDFNMLSVIRDNYDDCKRVMVELSNQKRNENIDILSFIG